MASPVDTIEGDIYPSMIIHKFNIIKDAEYSNYSKEHQENVAFRKSITEGWATIVPDYVEVEI